MDNKKQPERMASWDEVEEYWFHKGKDAIGSMVCIENTGLRRKSKDHKTQLTPESEIKSRTDV